MTNATLAKVTGSAWRSRGAWRGRWAATLPYTAPPVAAAASPSSSPAWRRRRLAPDPLEDSQPPSPSAKTRVLIVEDDLSSARALKMLLALNGFEPLVVTTVAQGMAELRGERPPDCVVLDLMLPDGDGAQILRYLRHSDPDVSVFVTTGVSDKQRLAQVRLRAPRPLLQNTT